jgi:hypothetical protein
MARPIPPEAPMTMALRSVLVMSKSSCVVVFMSWCSFCLVVFVRMWCAGVRVPVPV